MFFVLDISKKSVIVFLDVENGSLRLTSNKRRNVMGGINPPTPPPPNINSALGILRFSLLTSEARSLFEKSNIFFEKLLIAEVKKLGCSDIGEIINALESSKKKIEAAIEHTLADIESTSFLNGISSQHVRQVANDDETAHKLCELRMVSSNHWLNVTQVYADGGNYSDILSSLIDELNEIIVLTTKLVEIFDSLQVVTDEFGINRVMNENLPNNPKILYAQLYMSWINFQSHNLASSMFLSEAYYRSTNAESMVFAEVKSDCVN